MEKSKLQAMIRSLLVSYVISAVLLAVLAFLLYRLRLGEAQIHAGINLIYIFSCLVGGLLAGKAIRQRRFFWGLLSGAAYFLILLSVSFFMNRELGADTMNLITVFLMCAGSGTIGGMIS